MTMRRQGFVKDGGVPVTLVGEPVGVGDAAPEFTCVALGADGTLARVTLADTPAAVRLFSVVPSIDTDVCGIQTARFGRAIGALGDAVAAYAVSVDTPFAQGRFCSSEGVASITSLSDYRPERSFGNAWGVLVEETGELCRAVFVVDRGGRVVYVELVDDTDDHPDYDAALAAVEQASSRR